MPSRELETVVQMLRSRPRPADQSVAEQRVEMEALASLAPIADDVQCEPVEAGGVPAEWVSTSGAADGRIIYYLHGGGYSVGSITTHRELISRLSRAAAARALAVDYRLAPEHPFPAAVEDSTAAYRWLLASGVDPAGVVIAGDSAGGGLTVATLVALRDAGDPLPAAAVCLSPWVDLEGIGESMTANAEMDPTIQREDVLTMAKDYLGGADPRTPLAAPLYADLSGLPPLLIQVGSAETLLDDSTRLAELGRSVGVDITLEPWDDVFHVWQAFALLLPEGRQAIDRIGKFVRERLREPAGRSA
jgi:monoterpene epsilon-lactone hydrolase